MPDQEVKFRTAPMSMEEIALELTKLAVLHGALTKSSDRPHTIGKIYNAYYNLTVLRAHDAEAKASLDGLKGLAT